MAVMDGLGTFQVYKTGFSLFLMILFLCGAIALVVYTVNKNYISTTICNVTTNTDQSQLVTYTVNNKQYTKNVPPNVSTNNGVTTTNPAHSNGQCTFYYPSAEPDGTSYGVNSNPTTISFIIAGVLFVITIITYIWFMFLRSNKNVAGVVGGLDAADSVIGMFNRRRY